MWARERESDPASEKYAKERDAKRRKRKNEDEQRGTGKRRDEARKVRDSERGYK